MQALVATPGTAHTTRVADVLAPSAGRGQVLLRPLEVGVCGTDREISEGLFGVAPDGSERLVLGHEVLAVVERDAAGFARGDLVTATVRRSCGRCRACAAGSPDACETGDYRERGITRLDGFACELVAEDAAEVVPVPASLDRLGVLAEPASVCARALRQVDAVGARGHWAPARALVVGAGAIGVLAATFLRLDGLEVWTASREPGSSRKAELVTATGGIYVPLGDTSLAALAEEVGRFDLVVQAAPDAQTTLDAVASLRRNGVACVLGIDGREQRVGLDGPVVGVDLVLQNRAVFGSVNARRDDWVAGVELLDRARRRWPDAVEAFVGRRVPLDAFAEAFAFDGVKATLEVAS
jgi:threonine dehydrogenase-like Zn-dependent dehydrogenase